MISPTSFDLLLYNASWSSSTFSFDSSVCLRVSPLISLPIKTIVVSLRLKLSLTLLWLNRFAKWLRYYLPTFTSICRPLIHLRSSLIYSKQSFKVLRQTFLTPLWFNRLRGEATTYCFSLSFNSESFLAFQFKRSFLILWKAMSCISGWRILTHISTIPHNLLQFDSFQINRLPVPRSRTGILFLFSC